MGPREILDMLLEGDEGLRYLNTNRNKAQAVQPAQVSDGGDPVAEPEKAEQGVSGYAFPDDFEPEKGMKYPKSGQFPLSYIRTHVVGVLSESEDNLTGIDQDDRDPSRTDIDHDTSDELNDKHGSVSNEKPVTAIQSTSSYIPATTMARFPFKYLYGDEFKRVNERFYERQKFWNRTWDLYYLSVPLAISSASLPLVPTFQAQALIDEINSALNITLTLADKKGLVMEFNNEMLPRPVFLGRSSTPGQKEDLYCRITPGPENWGPWTRLLQPGVIEEFEKKIKQSIDTTKTKKQRKKASHNAQMKMWEDCLCRAQAYFGLRPPFKSNVPQPSFDKGQIAAVDVLKPAKWAFQDAPIFISIDLEWMDTHGYLTEVGISTLDMMDLQGVVPGDYGHMWMSQVRSRHLRVAEYRKWVNSTFSTGCPGSFRFGKSEMVPRGDVGKVVDTAFHPPYMVPMEDEVVPSYKNQKRTVILVGLDLQGDIMRLQNAGSQVFIHKNGHSSVIRETFDVAELHRVVTGEAQKRGLRALLGILNILSPDLHNAGNDAHYTLHALVRMMLRVAGERPWGYERAGVSEKSKSRPSDAPKVKIDPNDMPKFESMVPTCEEAVDSTDDAAVWSH